jgi:16S rRNA (adenine1518-N6/adenine1519-N6)-dimethyltransferase
MGISRPSELQALLRRLGIRPKKALSQNFLIDGNIVRKIVDAAEVKSGDQVVEVGPGPGALTERLLEVGAEVTAIEKDPVLAGALEGPDVICADALTVDYSTIVEGKAKLIANLPYQITTPLLTQLIPLPQFSSFTVMVQEEVAQRLTGVDPGSISIFIQFYCEVKSSFKVGRRCFYPVPKVDSRVVHLVKRTPPIEGDASHFFDLVRSAFQQRRKTLRASIGIEGELAGCRPQELSLDQWVDLATSE